MLRNEKEGSPIKFTFIHTADLHLDSPFKGLQQVPSSIRERIVQSTFNAFDQLIATALKQKVDFVVLAGDIFDQANRSLKAQFHFMKGLRKLSDQHIHTYIVHGNHDPLDGYIWEMQIPERVHIFSSIEVEAVPFYKNGQQLATIYGYSYPTRKVTENLAKRFKRKMGADDDSFAIGLLHTNCEEASEHENYAPCTISDLVQAEMDYWALGHVHTRKIIHTHPYIVYSGNLQGRHIREQGEKGFYIVEVDSFVGSRRSHQVKLAFQPAQVLLWLEGKLDVSGIEQMDQVLQAIENTCYQLREEYGQGEFPLIVRLMAEGETQLASQLSRAEIRQTLVQEWNESQVQRDDFIWIESLQFSGIHLYDRAELMADDGPLAELLKLIEQCKNNHMLRDEILRNALAPLFQHPRAGKYLEAWSIDEEEEILQRVETLIVTELIGGEKG